MGSPLQYQDLLGNGNAAGNPGDCPKGFVCLKNGNCGGRGPYRFQTQWLNGNIVMSRIISLVIF